MSQAGPCLCVKNAVHSTSSTRLIGVTADSSQYIRVSDCTIGSESRSTAIKQTQRIYASKLKQSSATGTNAAEFMSVVDSHSSPQLSGAFETETNVSLDVKQANFAFLSSMERGSLLPSSQMDQNVHEGSEVYSIHVSDKQGDRLIISSEMVSFCTTVLNSCLTILPVARNQGLHQEQIRVQILPSRLLVSAQCPPCARTLCLSRAWERSKSRAS